MDHETVEEREERVNEGGKLVVPAVAVEDEEGEDGVEDADGAAAFGGDTGIVGERDVGVGKEDHALMGEIAGAVEEIQTVVAVACLEVVAAVGHMP